MTRILKKTDRYDVLNTPFGQWLRWTSQRAGRPTAEGGETVVQPTKTLHES